MRRHLPAVHAASPKPAGDSATPDIGTLMLAATLAQEYFNGARLEDLTEQRRRDLYTEARDRRAHYLRQ